VQAGDEKNVVLNICQRSLLKVNTGIRNGSFPLEGEEKARLSGQYQNNKVYSYHFKLKGQFIHFHPRLPQN